MDAEITDPNHNRSAYHKAIELGWDSLARKDLTEIIHSKKAYPSDTAGQLELPLLGEWFVVDLERRIISKKEDASPASAVNSVLILHFLAKTVRVELSGKLITFREIPRGGSGYYPAFLRKAVAPLIKSFGSAPEKIIEASRRLGGARGDLGDVSITLDFFPGIPVTIVVWQGEEGIPDNANIFFDRSIIDHLPVEVISVIGEIVSSKLVEQFFRD